MNIRKVFNILLVALLISLLILLFLWVVLKLLNVTIDVARGDAIVLTFFGILATFVVVGNYSQVVNIKQQMNDSLRDTYDQMNNRLQTLSASVDSLKEQNTNLGQTITSNTGAISASNNNITATRNVLIRLIKNPHSEMFCQLFLQQEYECDITTKTGNKKAFASIENGNIVFRDTTNHKEIKGITLINGKPCNVKEMQKLVEQYLALDSNNALNSIYT